MQSKKEKRSAAAQQLYVLQLESYGCKWAAIVINTCPSLTNAPCDAKHQQDKLKCACQDIGCQRGPVGSWLERQRVDKDGAAWHLQAHHGDAQAADELGACGVEDLWQILTGGEHCRRAAEESSPSRDEQTRRRPAQDNRRHATNGLSPAREGRDLLGWWERLGWKRADEQKGDGANEDEVEQDDPCKCDCQAPFFSATLAGAQGLLTHLCSPLSLDSADAARRVREHTASVG